MGVPLAGRAGSSARLSGAARRGRSYMFMRVYWPLLGGFIAFVLIAVLIGWVMDPARRGDADHDRH